MPWRDGTLRPALTVNPEHESPAGLVGSEGNVGRGVNCDWLPVENEVIPEVEIADIALRTESGHFFADDEWSPKDCAGQRTCRTHLMVQPNGIGTFCRCEVVRCHANEVRQHAGIDYPEGITMGRRKHAGIHLPKVFKEHTIDRVAEASLQCPTAQDTHWHAYACAVDESVVLEIAPGRPEHSLDQRFECDCGIHEQFVRGIGQPGELLRDQLDLAECRFRGRFRSSFGSPIGHNPAEYGAGMRGVNDGRDLQRVGCDRRKHGSTVHPYD